MDSVVCAAGGMCGTAPPVVCMWGRGREKKEGQKVRVATDEKRKMKARKYNNNHCSQCRVPDELVKHEKNNCAYICSFVSLYNI